MKKIHYFPILLFWVQILSGQLLFHCTRDTITPYYYAWGDEFETRELDASLWDTHFGWGNTIPTNGEQQFYTHGDNLRFRDGKLIITAIRKDTNGICYPFKKEEDSLFNNGIFIGMNKRKFRFTSGLIQSKINFLYGFFEIRFRLSSNERGFWPAFWLYGGEPYEEIDWMEIKTEHPDKSTSNLHHGHKKKVHWKKLFFKKRFGGWIRMKNDNFHSGWVNVAGLWDSKDISFFIQYHKTGFYPNIMVQPKLLVANMAVSQDGWAFPPGPRPDFVGSVDFMIDYIRVWKPLQDSVIKLEIFNKAITENHEPSELHAPKRFISDKALLGSRKNLKSGDIFVRLVKKGDQIRCIPMGDFKKQKIKLIFGMMNGTSEEVLLDGNGEVVKNINVKNLKSICIRSNYQSKCVKIL